MRPENLKTRIFLDSGDPAETREVIKLLGFLDGQTTNPSLIAKNPETAGKKFTKQEILEFYKKVVQEVSSLIPKGSVSIEVYADKNTLAIDDDSTSPAFGTLPRPGEGRERSMLEQAREFYAWIPNAHIKFPTTTEGLKAAEIAVKEGMRVNLTLCFSQEQAAAVYAATRGAKKGQVFVSPFVGRLDDRGERGMDLIRNILRMYRGDLSLDPSPRQGRGGDGHVEVLTASVRNVEHIMEALKLGSDILTAPLKVLKEWSDLSLDPSPSPGEGNKNEPLSPGDGERMGERSILKAIPYQEIDLNKPWQEYDIKHELTDIGIEKFSADWNSLVSE